MLTVWVKQDGQWKVAATQVTAEQPNRSAGDASSVGAAAHPEQAGQPPRTSTEDQPTKKQDLTAEASSALQNRPLKQWGGIVFRAIPLAQSGSARLEEQRNPQSEAEAIKVIAAFNEAGNKRDLEGLRNALNFPYIRIASGNVRIAHTREDFTSDAPPQWQAEGWHHSTVDSVEIIQSSADKVHAAVVFSRYKADSTRYATYRTLRIITKQNGHWGIQCSSSFAP